MVSKRSNYRDYVGETEKSKMRPCPKLIRPSHVLISADPLGPSAREAEEQSDRSTPPPHPSGPQQSGKGWSGHLSRKIHITALLATFIQRCRFMKYEQESTLSKNANTNSACENCCRDFEVRVGALCAHWSDSTCRSNLDE